MKAGPAPSWLWLCGLAYCQEGLTDGFIPSEALNYLGVKNAKQLSSHLVKAQLWEVVDGGWQVHHYLEHNRSAVDVALLKRRRGDGGSLGGRPSKETLPETLPVNLQGLSRETLVVNLTGNPSTSTATPTASTTAPATPSAPEEGALDVAFIQFRDTYPKERRKGGWMFQTAFIDECRKAGGSAVLMAALVNHVASEQWANPKHIPGMDTWLAEERWRQTLPAVSAPQASSSSVPQWLRKKAQA